MNEISTYILTKPSSQGRLFKSLAKEMGWIIKKPKTKKKSCSMYKAMEDIKGESQHTRALTTSSAKWTSKITFYNINNVLTL